MGIDKTQCCGADLTKKHACDTGPIFWNEFNKVVQCHACGCTYEYNKPHPTCSTCRHLDGLGCFIHDLYPTKDFYCADHEAKEEVRGEL